MSQPTVELRSFKKGTRRERLWLLMALLKAIVVDGAKVYLSGTAYPSGK